MLEVHFGGRSGEIIADRRRSTRDDLVSQLISAEVEGPQAHPRADIPLAPNLPVRFDPA